MTSQRKSIVAKTITFILLLGLIPIFAIKGLVWSTSAQSPKEREVEDKTPKHLPLRIKIKAEKEKAVKDLKNENWMDDWELEVTNTSDKPIYFLEIWLIFPDISSGSDVKVGIPLRYGRMEFVHFNTVPIPEDIPILPGQPHTFTIPPKYKTGWAARKASGYMTNPKKIEIRFEQLSFGDGSGFIRSDAVPYPYKREKVSSGRCQVPSDDNDTQTARLRIRFPLSQRTLFDTKPAFQPVYFSSMLKNIAVITCRFNLARLQGVEKDR